MQTCLATFFTPAASPLAALSHSEISFVFSSLVSVGAAFTVDLQAETASCTAGLLAMPAPPLEPLVEELLDDAPAALDDELLLALLPQPATNAALTTATATNELNRETIKPPAFCLVHRLGR